jgi:hypothetical protein
MKASPRIPGRRSKERRSRPRYAPVGNFRAYRGGIVGLFVCHGATRIRPNPADTGVPGVELFGSFAQPPR